MEAAAAGGAKPGGEGGGSSSAGVAAAGTAAARPRSGKDGENKEDADKEKVGAQAGPGRWAGWARERRGGVFCGLGCKGGVHKLVREVARPATSSCGARNPMKGGRGRGGGALLLDFVVWRLTTHSIRDGARRGGKADSAAMIAPVMRRTYVCTLSSPEQKLSTGVRLKQYAGT